MQDHQSPTPTQLTLNRRTLLKHLALLSGAAAFPVASFVGCSQKPTQEVVDGSARIEPFATYEEIIAALRTSPDHLPAQAKKLVAAKDAQGLFQLVHQQILTYPDAANTFPHYAPTAVRWGSKATLRGGGGTMREKCDLLCELLQEAGYEAQVVRQYMELSEVQLKKILFRPYEPVFAPDVDKATEVRWLDNLGFKANGTPEILDEAGKDSQNLAQILLKQLPEDYTKQLKNFQFKSGKTSVPLVEMTTAEGKRNLHFCGEEQKIADFPIVVSDKGVYSVGKASKTKKIEATLFAAFADDPKKKVKLVEGTWKAEEVIGRTITVQMQSNVTLEKSSEQTFRDARIFVPTLNLYGIDVDEKLRQEHSFAGDAITLTGDVVKVDDQGKVTINGHDMIVGVASASLDAVTQLELEVNSTRYPDINLKMKALDKSGKPVEGLSNADFKIEESGKSVAAMMMQNRIVPRVLFLLDGTASMPKEYNIDKVKVVAQELQDELSKKFPIAQIKAKKDYDHYWELLNQYAYDDYNLIVCITDGRVTDKLKPEMEDALKQCPPTLFINVQSETPEALQTLMDYVGGQEVKVENRAKAKEAIGKFVNVNRLAAYNFNYGSPTADEVQKRSVTISTKDGRVSQTVEYVIPKQDLKLTKRICGLYLEVGVNKSEMHHIAGYHKVLNKNTGVTPQNINETFGALFGTTLLAVEAGAPKTSIWLDDVLNSKLGLEEVLDACQSEEASDKEVKDTIANSREIPWQLYVAMPPIHEQVTETSLTYENGLRVVAFHQRPDFETNSIVSKMDILPLAEIRTVAGNAQEAYQLNVLKTIRSNIAEAAILKRSTWTLLKDKALLNAANIKYDKAEYAQIDKESRDFWYRLTYDDSYRNHIVMPKDGVETAYWAINEVTGEVFGILEDGSRGGSDVDRIKAQFAKIDKVIEYYNQALDALSISGAQVSIAVAYSQMLVRLYAAVSIAIASMNTHGLDEKVRAAVVKMACTLAKELAYGVFNKMGGKFGAIAGVLGQVEGYIGKYNKFGKLIGKEMVNPLDC